MLKKFCLENWKSILWMIVAGFAMTCFWVPPWSRPLASYLRVGSFTASLWIFVWLGNAYTSGFVSSKISWTAAPVRRFVVGMIVMVVYTLTALIFVVAFFEYVVGMSFRGDVDQLIFTTMSITFVISLFMHGRSFLENWKTAELNAERLQKESVKAQYDSLKNLPERPPSFARPGAADPIGSMIDTIEAAASLKKSCAVASCVDSHQPPVPMNNSRAVCASTGPITLAAPCDEK